MSDYRLGKKVLTSALHAVVFADCYRNSPGYIGIKNAGRYVRWYPTPASCRRIERLVADWAEPLELSKHRCVIVPLF